MVLRYDKEDYISYEKIKHLMIGYKKSSICFVVDDSALDVGTDIYVSDEKIGRGIYCLSYHWLEKAISIAVLHSLV